MNDKKHVPPAVLSGEPERELEHELRPPLAHELGEFRVVVGKVEEGC